MKKVLSIVGPTGVGKSKLAIELAKLFNGEIISVDSIQVYRGLDIGSAKVMPSEMEGIVHHNIDIKDPKESYSVYEFQQYARQLIDDITNRHKLPILVGGTGLYVKACLYDYEFQKELQTPDTSQYDHLTNEALYRLLQERDYESSLKVHMNNRKRLIRCLMVCDSGEKKSVLEQKQSHTLQYDAYILGLDMPKPQLYELVEKRVALMFKAGIAQEIDELLKKGVTFDDQSMQGIGYREFKDYYNHEASYEEVERLIVKHTKNFIKRQYTWFKNQMPVHWFLYNQVEEMIEDVKKWYE